MHFDARGKFQKSLVAPMRLPLFNETLYTLLPIVELQVVSHRFSAGSVGWVQIHSQLLIIKAFAETNNFSWFPFDRIANNFDFFIKFLAWNDRTYHPNTKRFFWCNWKSREKHVARFHSWNHSRDRNAWSTAKDSKGGTGSWERTFLTTDCNVTRNSEL